MSHNWVTKDGEHALHDFTAQATKDVTPEQHTMISKSPAHCVADCVRHSPSQRLHCVADCVRHSPSQRLPYAGAATGLRSGPRLGYAVPHLGLGDAAQGQVASACLGGRKRFVACRETWWQRWPGPAPFPRHPFDHIGAARTAGRSPMAHSCARRRTHCKAIATRPGTSSNTASRAPLSRLYCATNHDPMSTETPA
jgi:hypothetical protein